MAKCGAIKKDGERCTFNAKGDSGYCGKHKNYKADKSDTDEKRHEELIEKIEELEKKSESTKKKLLDKIEESEKKSESRFWRSVIISSISILIAIGGVWIGYWYFTEQVKLSSPVILQVNHTVKYNGSDGTLEINITNTHPLRETGAVYIYRLEINPDRPFRILESLKPMQSTTYNLSFKIEKGFETYEKIYDYDNLDDNVAKVMYYTSEECSISYKISCDNCPSQGVIRKEPGFGSIRREGDWRYLNSSGYLSGWSAYATYSWVEYEPEYVSLAEATEYSKNIKDMNLSLSDPFVRIILENDQKRIESRQK